MRNPLRIKVTEIARHRNGVGGNPFHAVTFTAHVGGRKATTFLATVFDGQGNIAVIATSLLATMGVEFGSNSWRGDDFEPTVREAIGQWEDAEWARFEARCNDEVTL